VISLLLAASQPRHYIVYRQSLVRRACRQWALDCPEGDTIGARYAAYLGWAGAIRNCLSAAFGHPADLIDVYAFLSASPGHAKRRKSAHTAAPASDAAAVPDAVASTPVSLRERAEESYAAELSEPLPAQLAALRQVAARTHNILLQGPPGVGKTYWARRFARIFTDPRCVETVTFHPSFAYEEFVEGLRPVAAEG